MVQRECHRQRAGNEAGNWESEPAGDCLYHACASAGSGGLSSACALGQRLGFDFVRSLDACPLFAAT